MVVSRGVRVWSSSLTIPLSTQVLRGHAKSDVLDIVKDLHLPLAQGDLSLLKKLQALGLHSNRWVNTIVDTLTLICEAYTLLWFFFFPNSKGLLHV